MSALTIYKELRTRYNSAWTPPPTEFPNEKFDKPVPAALWARFTVLNGMENQLDIGATQKLFRESGSLVIQLFAPMTSGAVGILGSADTIANAFRNWCGATVICREATVMNIGNDNFGWYQVNVIVPFQVNVIH